jgi:hypothetical protein
VIRYELCVTATLASPSRCPSRFLTQESKGSKSNLKPCGPLRHRGQRAPTDNSAKYSAHSRGFPDIDTRRSLESTHPVLGARPHVPAPASLPRLPSSPPILASHPRPHVPAPASLPRPPIHSESAAAACASRNDATGRRVSVACVGDTHPARVSISLMKVRGSLDRHRIRPIVTPTDHLCEPCTSL